MLSLSHLRKQYASVLAVDDVSFTVKRGEILGLIGPNGAGKTTTIRMVLDVIRPDSGSISIDGMPLSAAQRDLIGYLPEERGLYRKSRVLNTLMYFGSLKGLKAADARARAYAWLKRFDLLDAFERRVDELSKGNQQKIQFIISVLHDPELVILDEPFSGFDPVNQLLLKDMLLELKQRGKAIIFSTHQMDQAERLCDTICLINRGRVVLDGGLADVKRRYGRNTVHLEFEGDGAFLSSHPSVQTAQVYENAAEVILRESCTPHEVLREIAGRLDIRRFEASQPSLNSIFLLAVGSTAAQTSRMPPENIPVGRKIVPPAVRGARARLLRSLIGAAAIIGVMIAMNGFSWMPPALGAAVVIGGLVRYRKDLRTPPAPGDGSTQ